MKSKNKIYQLSLAFLFIHLLILPVEAEKEGKEKDKKYSSSTSFSFVLTRGNNRDFSFSLETDQDIHLKKNRLNLKGIIIYSSSNNKKRSEIYYSHLKYARELNSRAYLLAVLRVDRNKLAGHNFRFAFSGGGGYTWIKRERVEIYSEAAIGWSSENNLEKFGSRDINDEVFTGERTVSSSFLSSIFSSKLVYNFTSTAQFVYHEVLFFNMEDWQDYRLNSYASLSASISRYFALKTSVRVIYERKPVPGHKSTDFFLLSSIVIKI